LASYRVRLGDGSVIDLGVAEVQSWYESGLVNDDTQVQKAGARDWSRLGQAVDMRGWKRPGAPRGVSVPAARGPQAARPSAPRAPAPKAFTESRPLRRASAPAVEWGRWARVAAAIAVPLLVLYLAAPFVVPLLFGTAEERRVKAATVPEKRYSGVGVTLDVPPRWSLLRADHSLFTVPANARVSLAEPKAGGFAVLAAETPARAYPSLDAFLDRVVEERRAAEPGLRVVRREDAEGKARRVVAARAAGEAAMEEIFTAWRDGFTYYALVVWEPEAAGRAVHDSDEIRRGITVTGRQAAQVEQGVAAVTAAVPLLTAAAAETLIGQSQAGALDPAEAFRRTYQMAGRGLPALAAAEQRDMGALSTEMYNRLSAADRARLGPYLDRVRAGRATDPGDDATMSRLVKTAFAKLPAARQKRLQSLFEKAIAAAVQAESR
jgi:hypothetical protein